MKAFQTKGHASRQPEPAAKKPFRLDLRHDIESVRAYIRERVQSFERPQDSRAGTRDLIRLIELGFECTQSGWAVLVFDVRQNAQPDGEWTSQVQDLALPCPHWRKATAANQNGPITLVSTDGSEAVLMEQTELAELIGLMLKDTLLQASADGVFATLPLASDFRLHLEDFDGHFSWP